MVKGLLHNSGENTDRVVDPLLCWFPGSKNREEYLGSGSAAPQPLGSAAESSDFVPSEEGEGGALREESSWVNVECPQEVCVIRTIHVRGCSTFIVFRRWGRGL